MLPAVLAVETESFATKAFTYHFKPFFHVPYVYAVSADRAPQQKRFLQKQLTPTFHLFYSPCNMLTKWINHSKCATIKKRENVVFLLFLSIDKKSSMGVAGVLII